jgi:LmbE family N-acetylglucosaminyl deacetylase
MSIGVLSNSSFKTSGQSGPGSATSKPACAPQARTADELNGHVVVVSPHFDDAIMSLGSTIAQAVQSGAKVDVLTVFADLPSSDAPASAWDRECGFSTEGQAASVRRDEDRRACSIVGAESRWLNFGSECYERRGSEDDIWHEVAAAVGGADSVIIPGFPLAHADHACLSNLLVRKGLDVQRVGLYVEQPYEFYLKKSQRHLTVAPPLEPLVDRSIAWARTRTARTHHHAKLQAVRCYRSQLRHLGLGTIRLRRMLWREAAQGGETIGWLR